MPWDADVSDASGPSSSSYTSITDASTGNAADEPAAHHGVRDVEALVAADDPHPGLVRRRQQLGRRHAERVGEVAQRLEPRVAARRLDLRERRLGDARARGQVGRGEPAVLAQLAHVPREDSGQVLHGRGVVPSSTCSVFRSRVEVERVVAALAADARDPDAAERRREVAHEEGVDPDRAGAHRAADPLGALRAAGVDDAPRARTRSSWRARCASASSANVWNVSTGPKTSRCTISESFERGRTSVGSYSSPPWAARWPPRTISSPAARARSTKPSTRAR